jgi:alanyl aminopeptidase
VVHHFETSRPLPSYLVAFAVGDFDVTAGQTSPFPIRVVTTKGRGNLAGPALEAAAALIDKLGDYFGVRYPYPKLDLVAVPDFAAGAMENPGLVTFRDERLLIDPQHVTTNARRQMALVIAHEFAHQWFGDLVTMKWWDDIWLNEGFATWAEAKMVDAWKPSFGARVEQIAQVQHVMDTDALKSARAVRQPVLSTGDAEEAFDGITYEKGAAVLRMIEGWLGPDTFRRGVQRYIHDNAWKNASAEDLFKALDFVSTQQVGQLASGFLDHPGVPSVLVSWKCGGKNGSKLELRESEWRPLGEGGDAPRTWTLPVCVASDTQKAKSCFTLGAEPIARDLGAQCPTWLYPNAEEAGYYRFVVDRLQLLALARSERSLDPIDRLGLVSNAWAEVRQGAISPSALLDVLPTFDGEMNHHVVEQIADTLSDVDDSLVDEAARPAFRRYAAARMAARKAALGWEAPKGAKEDDDRALARHSVLQALGAVADDKATLAEAEKYTQKWLKDPMSVPEDTAAVAVPLASIHAGQYRIDELRAAAKAAKTPEDRVIAVRALGAFEDPVVLRKALDLTFSGEIRLGELRYLLGTALAHRAARPVLYAWEKENWAKLRARLPGFIGRGILVRVAGTMCTRADLDDAKGFFESGTKDIEGVKRPLDESLEEAGLCTTLREHGAAEVTKYLEKR